MCSIILTYKIFIIKNAMRLIKEMLKIQISK